MKTNNLLKSIGLMTLGSIGTLAMSFSLTNLNTDESPKECVNDGSSNIVCLETASNQIDLYKRWLNNVPKHFQFDTEERRLIFNDTIPLDTITFNIIDSLAVRYYDSLKSGNSDTSREDVYNNLPFHGSNLDIAYFISADDIFNAFELTKPDDLFFNGIRVYIGINHMNTLDPTMVASHLYVTPTVLTDSLLPEPEYGQTFYSNDSIPETSDGEQYLYDLTAPCPAYCDVSGNALH